MILWSCDKKNSSKIEEQESIPVTLYKVQKAESALKVVSSGVLSPENDVKYSFKIGGVVEKITVSEGDSFKKGTLLARLKVEEIEAGVAQAQLGFEKAQRDAQRIEKLFKDSVASLEQYQNSLTALEISKRQLEVVEFNKKYSSIYATQDGFVIKKLVNEGEIIAPGFPILATSENQNNTWILEVGLNDREWALVEKGNPSEIYFDAYPDQIFKGIVSRKSRTVDVAVGSFTVDIKVDLNQYSPALGMFGKATIFSNKKTKYHSLPNNVLIEADGLSAYVFVPEKFGKVRKQAVEIASIQPGEVWIKKGLEDVSEVVQGNSAFLNENSIIRIIK